MFSLSIIIIFIIVLLPPWWKVSQTLSLSVQKHSFLSPLPGSIAPYADSTSADGSFEAEQIQPRFEVNLLLLLLINVFYIVRAFGSAT